MTNEEAAKYHFAKAVVRYTVAHHCREAAKTDARFSEAAKYWMAASIYSSALALKALSEIKREALPITSD